MALSDFLKNLSGNVLTPGVEELISSVPMLVGAFESGRGKSVGRPLEVLGQMGMTHAANRQAEHQKEGDISGRLQSMSAQGLLPKDFYSSGTAEAILGGSGPNATGMSPEAADKELADIQNRQVAAQTREQSMVDELAKEERAHEYAGKKPEYLSTTSKEAYLKDAQGNRYRAPQFDRQPSDLVKTPFQLFQKGMQSGDFSGWNAYQATQAQQQVGVANAKVAGRAKLLYDVKLMRPFQMAPEMKGQIALDRDTMRPVTGKTLKDILDNPDQYAVTDKKTATETIPNMAAGRNELIKMAQYSAKVLPHGTGAKLNDWATTYANRWRIPFRALSGGVNEAMFGAERTATAMQLQKAFTGSTRPVNLVEFTRITGDAHEGPLTSKDIDAVLPTSRDTYEIAQQKLTVLKEMFDNKLSELNMKSPAPGFKAMAIADAMKTAVENPESPTAETPEAAPPAETPEPDDGGFDVH